MARVHTVIDQIVEDYRASGVDHGDLLSLLVSAREVDRKLAGRLPGFDDVARLDYTRRTVTEVLRLYPPVWLLTRAVTDDTELGGHRLNAGTMIVFSPYLVHRDPRLFAEPDRFDPDRWLPERSRAPRGAASSPSEAAAASASATTSP